MCMPASFVVTKDDVLWLKGVNSHTEILEANGLKDETKNPAFVRVEINPPEKDGIPQYNAPLSKWVYRTDQDYLPKWYVAEVEEERVRKVLPEWYISHIEGQITDAPYVDQRAGYRSTQTAGYCSTQTAGNNSTQTAGDYSTQKAGNNSTQTAELNSVQIGWWYDEGAYRVVSRVVTRAEANKPYLFKDGVWTLVEGQ